MRRSGRGTTTAAPRGSARATALEPRARPPARPPLATNMPPPPPAKINSGRPPRSASGLSGSQAQPERQMLLGLLYLLYESSRYARHHMKRAVEPSGQRNGFSRKR